MRFWCRVFHKTGDALLNACQRFIKNTKTKQYRCLSLSFSIFLSQFTIARFQSTLLCQFIELNRIAYISGIHLHVTGCLKFYIFFRHNKIILFDTSIPLAHNWVLRFHLWWLGPTNSKLSVLRTFGERFASTFLSCLNWDWQQEQD